MGQAMRTWRSPTSDSSSATAADQGKIRAATKVCPTCGPVPPVQLPDGGYVPGLCKCDWRDMQSAELDRLARNLRDARVRASGVPKNLQTATLDGFIPRRGTKLAIDAAVRYLKRWPDPVSVGDGLLLMGPPGTGKSHIAAAIALDVARRGYRARFESVPALMDRFDRAAGDDPPETTTNLYERLASYVLLVLDDLGAQRWTEAREDRILRVLDARVSALRPTIATTNLGMHELLARIGARALDRLVGSCLVVSLDGATSYRQEVAARRVKASQQVGG